MKFGIWVLFDTLSRKFKVDWNLTRIRGTLDEDSYAFMVIPRSVLLRMRCFQTKVAEKIKTHFLFSNFFSKILPNLWDNVEKIVQATDGNMTHVRCMLDTYSYKHTLRICNTYCFSTATMVALTRLNVTYTYIVCLVLSYSFWTTISWRVLG